MTAGTIFDRTRTPLTVWFHACWLFATAKDGISALSLQRALEIGDGSSARARGDDPGELLPAVHRVASLAKRWLLGTHQGSVDEAHPQRATWTSSCSGSTAAGPAAAGWSSTV